MEKRKKEGIIDWCRMLLPFSKADEYGTLYIGKKGKPHEYIGEGDKRFPSTVVEHLCEFDVSYLDKLVKNLKSRLPEGPAGMLSYDNDIITLKNGQYNIRTAEFIPKAQIASDWTFRIEIPYVEDAASPVVDKFFDDLSDGDVEIRRMLLLPFAYALFPSIRYLPLIFFITGEGANGKSVYIKLGESLIGRDRSFDFTPAHFSNRFAPSCLVGKRYVKGADIPSTSLDATACANLKMLSSDDDMFIEGKGEKGESFRGIKPTAVFACNRMPDVKDKSQGLCRRLVIIETKKSHTEAKNNCDPHMFEKLTTPDSLQYLLRLVIDLAVEIRHVDCISLPQVVLDRQEAIHRGGEDVMDFFRQKTKNTFTNRPVKDIYDDYIRWCVDNQRVPISDKIFWRTLSKYMNAKTVTRRDGDVVYRVYESPERPAGSQAEDGEDMYADGSIMAM